MAKERVWMMGCMVVASFVGGIAANLFLTTRVDAQGAPQVLTTSQLNLVDQSGRLRGILAGTDERGLSSLTFYDETGQMRGVFGIEPDGTPVSRLLDASGQTRLLTTLQGEDAFVVVGADRETQGMFGSIQGNPMVTFGDGARSRMQLHLTPEGFPRMAMADTSGSEAVSLTVGSDDMPQVTLSAGGRPRTIMTVAQNATLLNLFDESRTRLVVGVAENGLPSVSFFDENGAPYSQLPQ